MPPARIPLGLLQVLLGRRGSGAVSFSGLKSALMNPLPLPAAPGTPQLPALKFGNASFYLLTSNMTPVTRNDALNLLAVAAH